MHSQVAARGKGSRWSRSQFSAGRVQPGWVQVTSRAMTCSASGAGGLYLVRPRSSRVPERGSVTRRRQVEVGWKARARAAAGVIAPYPVR